MQMIPLILLKAKMYTCGDRLSLVPRVLVKTLLMHAILSILRMGPYFMQTSYNLWSYEFLFDSSAFVVCVGLLWKVFDFRFSWRTILDEREVRNLVVMAILGAAAAEVACLYLPLAWVTEGTKLYIADGDLANKILFTAANYVDVLAFLPVVMKLYQAESDDDDFASGTQLPEDARKQVLVFFLFVCGFYSWDDVITPSRMMSDMDAVSMMAHGAHFVLLLDFACFFIFQVWTPSSTKGEQLQGLLEAGYEQDD